LFYAKYTWACAEHMVDGVGTKGESAATNII